MSVENVKAFYAKVAGDKELQERIKTLAQKERAAIDAIRAELISMATDAGYPFTTDELAEASNENINNLSHDELKSFAVSPIYKIISCEHENSVRCYQDDGPFGLCDHIPHP